MIYQLPNGKCITISLETYLNMRDEDFDMYIAANTGNSIEDPFAMSVLKYGEAINNEEVFGDFDEEEIKDLLLIDFEEKIIDTDFINPDELET